MTGHCEACREFSLVLLRVEVRSSEGMAGGEIVPAWHMNLCPACEETSE